MENRITKTVLISPKTNSGDTGTLVLAPRGLHGPVYGRGGCGNRSVNTQQRRRGAVRNAYSSETMPSTATVSCCTKHTVVAVEVVVVVAVVVMYYYYYLHLQTRAFFTIKCPPPSPVLQPLVLSPLPSALVGPPTPNEPVNEPGV